MAYREDFQNLTPRTVNLYVLESVNGIIFMVCTDFD